MIASIYGDAVRRKASVQRTRAMMMQSAWRPTLMLLLGPDEFRALLASVAGEPDGPVLVNPDKLTYEGMQIVRTTEPMVQVVWAP